MYLSATEQLDMNSKTMQHYVDEMPIDEARIRFDYNQTKTTSYYVCKAKIFEVDKLIPSINTSEYESNLNIYNSIIKTGALLMKMGAPWKIQINKTIENKE